MNSPLQYGDGYIVRNNPTDIAESKAFLQAVWSQIAAAFNNSYGQRLIFETMNEPRNCGHTGYNPIKDENTSHEWSPGLAVEWKEPDEKGNYYYWCNFTECEECIADYKILNEYNQLCLDTIRSSGGNNASRFVMIPSLCTGMEEALHQEFKLPQDTATDKLILTVHNYTLGPNKENVKTEITPFMKYQLEKDLTALNEKYIKNGIPVVLGETGALRKLIDKPVRIEWYKYFCGLCASYNIPVCWWDCGADREATMAELNRTSLKPYEADFVKMFTGAFE